jgi:hypothetical protein
VSLQALFACQAGGQFGLTAARQGWLKLVGCWTGRSSPFADDDAPRLSQWRCTQNGLFRLQDLQSRSKGLVSHAPAAWLHALLASRPPHFPLPPNPQKRPHNQKLLAHLPAV